MAKEKLRLKPAPGRTVPLEDGSPWPTKPNGRDKTPAPVELSVASSLYWRRRIRSGDVIDLDADAALRAEKAEAQQGADAKKGGK
ncbi:hypothetical protein [Oceaniradius stylonematis]|uniref:hypothetical protein n=1 Tax=Oceaniradius stylonematis TaxID=2184161 RepID=UPI00273F944C|nr:hypothetical protein [Oceaniradius stylonematis]